MISFRQRKALTATGRSLLRLISMRWIRRSQSSAFDTLMSKLDGEIRHRKPREGTTDAERGVKFFSENLSA